jgi:glycosyltransferase involved in cell wall biosynthesis
MAMARPVVASPAAFEGIEAQAGRDLIVADGAEATAAEIRKLLADLLRSAAIGQAARRLVTGSYSWESRLAPLEAMLAPARQAA